MYLYQFLSKEVGWFNVVIFQQVRSHFHHPLLELRHLTECSLPSGEGGRERGREGGRERVMEGGREGEREEGRRGSKAEV